MKRCQCYFTFPGPRPQYTEFSTEHSPKGINGSEAVKGARLPQDLCSTRSHEQREPGAALRGSSRCRHILERLKIHSFKMFLLSACCVPGALLWWLCGQDSGSGVVSDAFAALFSDSLPDAHGCPKAP